MNSTLKIELLALASCLMLLVSPAIGGQSNATLSGPVLGYVFSPPEGKLRPLRGVLGSATIGDPLELDFAISQALPLDASHFIVSTSASPELLAIGLENSPISLGVISAAPSNPSQAAASVHGTAAAFYYASTQSVRIVTGLPGSPAVSQSVDLTNLSGQLLTHVAVSDDGALVVYSVAEVDRESVYVWTPSSASSRYVFSIVSTGGIAITGSGTAIVTDSKANEVFAVFDARNAAVSQFLLGERDGVSRPGEVTIAAFDQILIANLGSANVMTLNPNGRLLRTQSCNCSLAGLFLVRDSIFRLTDRLNRPLFLLQTSSTGDRILFVPALRNGR